MSDDTPPPLRFGIAGLGTVGSALVALLQEHGDLLDRRSRRPLRLTHVSARERGRERGVSLTDYVWESDPLALARTADIDAVVELIGGSDGIARDLAFATLESGRHLITANKALLAHCGTELAALAESKGCNLFFEAAVGGAMPCVEMLRDSLVGNDILRLRGILNGTCNYVLTAMERGAKSLDAALEKARESGFAEADSSIDLEGWDSAHKLSLLSALSFGERPDLAAISVEGIMSLGAEDFAFADELGYRIRLLGLAEPRAEGILRAVRPCLLPKTASLARILGATNAIEVKGDYAGPILLEGLGAGGRATATAVAGDLVQLAEGAVRPVFGRPASRLAPASPSPEALVGSYYMRFRLDATDANPAAIVAAVDAAGVAVKTMEHRPFLSGTSASSLVMTAHDVRERAVANALAACVAGDLCAPSPVMLRIESA